MLDVNYMHTNTISDSGSLEELKTQLADDDLEVRGFGMPITNDVARGMCDDYFREWKKCDKIVKRIINEPRFTELKNDPNFTGFAKIFDPKAQTASGVFGKEILLAILAQRDCEGIRYVVGSGPDNKNTIILFGVTHTKNPDGSDRIIDKNDRHMAVSERSTVTRNLPTQDGVNDGPIDVEVHNHSLTMDEAKVLAPEKFDQDLLSDIVFGAY